jgi:hypothetical protein
VTTQNTPTQSAKLDGEASTEKSLLSGSQMMELPSKKSILIKSVRPSNVPCSLGSTDESNADYIREVAS